MMKSALLWTRENLLIPIAMVVVTALAAFSYQSTEINAQQYTTLTATYKDGSDRYRTIVQKAAAAGTVTKWEFIDLMNNFWVDAHGLYLDSATDASQLGQARVAFQEAVRQKSRRP
jgi:hypothetical protein